jgi:mannitol-1-phosphate 5-dehydrogenase
MSNRNNKIVIFGAGKIGRSFIGQVFSKGGYEVVFVDIDSVLIDQLNSKKRYNVVVKSNSGDVIIPVSNVRGINIEESDKIKDELAGAELAAISVGQSGLHGVIPMIASALLARKKLYGHWPLDIIIAENMRNSDHYISKELKKYLPEDFLINEMVGMVETSIGKMVPIMTENDKQEDSLQVFAEPYDSLIVARKGFKNPVPKIDQLSPKNNIKAWVDLKLFVHNLGHATAAYLGYQHNPGIQYIYEALDIDEIFTVCRETMLQSSSLLQTLYPGEFTDELLENHIDDLLSRFRNKALGDTIYRVGCDLFRKLGPDDRLTAPIKVAMNQGQPYNLIMNALVAGISFRATDQEGKHHPADIIFFREAGKGLTYVLENICRL